MISNIMVGTVSVFIAKEEITVAQEPRFTVSSSSGEQKTKTITLATEGVIRNAKMAFDVVSGTGTLFIFVDGVEVFSGTPSGQIVPISLPRLTAESVIRFETETVSGFQLFSSFAYEIANLKIVATKEII